MRLHVQKMIRNEFGGVNESFYNLYAITGDERHRWLAQFFYHNEVIDPLKELRDDLGTKHTNTFIPKVIAEARNYELTEDENSRKLSDFFWHTMIDHHTFAPDAVVTRNIILIRPGSPSMCQVIPGKRVVPIIC